MSEREGITAEEVREIAAGAVTGWAPGWTGDDGVNPQRRVRVSGFGDGYVVLLVEGAPGSGEPDRAFRVVLTVFELVTEEAAARLRDEVREAVRQNSVKFSPPAYPYIAPVETGEPFRSAVQGEWDDSYGPE